MGSTEGWPSRLCLVRHGESAGNVARDYAEANGLERIQLAHRDVDVPLSEAGEGQAAALGRWMASLPAEERFDCVWVSPYVRAQQTAGLAVAEAGLDIPVIVDERLREREFGVLDGLTRKGIIALWPQESERRTAVGKFYHRPPGGESWTDAALRVRSAVGDIRRDWSGQRVMVVAHQVVVLLFRYVVEGMTEAEILAVDAEGDVANCSWTTYAHDARGEPVLVGYNRVDHLRAQDEAVTAEPDAAHGPR
jgi:broad specificity phosphatase PhoE